MPDRDVFNTLLPQFRSAARSLHRMALGGAPEALPVAEALNALMQGGVPALPALLKYLAFREGPHFPALFQDPSFASSERKALRVACSTPAGGWKEELLLRAAIHAQVQGVYDAQPILRDFAMRILKFKIIEVQGGVADQLNKRGELFVAARLEADLSPLLDTAARLMQRNPHFKRLGLASKYRDDVALGENLL